MSEENSIIEANNKSSSQIKEESFNNEDDYPERKPS